MSITGDITTEQAIIIASHGIIMILFAFVPFFLIIKRELDKFSSNSKTEHDSGRSIFTFLITTMIVLAFASILYTLVAQTLGFIFPNTHPVTGEGGVTSLFWSIDLSAADALTTDINQAGSALKSILKGISILRIIIDMLSVFTVITLFAFSAMLAWNAMGLYQDDSQRNSVVAAVVKIMLASTVAAVALEYYSLSTSWILNLPDEGSIKEISQKWFTEAIDAAMNSD